MQLKMRHLSRLKVTLLKIFNFKKINFSLLISFVYFSIGFLLFLSPAGLNAGEIASSLNESDGKEIVDAPSQMTQKQMNDLFGEDPYLGQTSYLQSPDGFSQRDKSK